MDKDMQMTTGQKKRYLQRYQVISKQRGARKIFSCRAPKKLISTLQQKGFTDLQILDTYERAMGFPIGWTELNH